MSGPDSPTPGGESQETGSLSQGLNQIYSQANPAQADPAPPNPGQPTPAAPELPAPAEAPATAEAAPEGPSPEELTPEELDLERLDTESPALPEPPPEELEPTTEPQPAEPQPLEAQPAEPEQMEAQPAEGTEPAPPPTPPEEVAPADASAEASAEVSAETSAAPSAGFSDDLDEQVLPPSQPAGPQPGDELGGHRLNEDLGRGYFTASPLHSGPSVDVYVRPSPSWAGLRPHRVLPRFTQSGELYVFEPVSGEALAAPLDSPRALAALRDLAQLLFALEKQGYAVTDLDPDAVRAVPGGLRLRFPPRVAPLGQPPEPALREGFTPPEVQGGQPADARSGVYLLGALLHLWLTGQALPPEGLSAGTLAGLRVPGGPQLLWQTLAPLDRRPTPAGLLDTLRQLGAEPAPTYQLAAATTVGLNPDRPVNEDSYGFVWRQIGEHGGTSLTLRACVSDGMGGMAAGEVASQAAVRAFLDSAGPDLEAAVWAANAAVLEAMAGRDGGCTLSGVELRGAQLHLGHVGDTRAYLYRAGDAQTTPLTQDHSFVAAMVASGQMTPEEAQHSPDRNKVLRSLGSLRVPQPGYVQTLPEPLTLRPGDRVLLLSDGVWGEVEPAQIGELLAGERDLQVIVDRLVSWALEAGAPDNATALVIEQRPPSRAEGPGAGAEIP